MKLEQQTIKKGAVIDPSGLYRYLLWREWQAFGPKVTFIMLNPSQADAIADDPTIRRCIGLAQRWGYGAMNVVNLFGYRTAHPMELQRVGDPVGPDNDRHLQSAVEQAQSVILAWGNQGILGDRNQDVLQQLSGPRPLYCLGITKAGHPRHPLYLRNTVIPMAYPRSAE